MHLYYDFIDVLEYIFIKEDLFRQIKLSKIKGKDILFDSKKIFSQKFSSKKDTIICNLKKLKKIFKKNKIVMFFPGVTLTQNKQNVTGYQKIQSAEQKFNFLNIIDDMYQESEKISQFRSQLDYVQKQCNLRKFFFVWQHQRTLLKYCSQFGIEVQRSKNIVDLQIKQIMNQKLDHIVFGSIGLFFISQQNVNIIQKIQNKLAYIFDFQKFSKFLKLQNPQNIKNYLQWALVIYSCLINNTQGLLYYQTIIENTHNILQQHEFILKNQALTVLDFIKKLDKNFKRDIELNDKDKILKLFEINENQFEKIIKEYQQFFTFNQKNQEVKNNSSQTSKFFKVLDNQSQLLTIIPYIIIDCIDQKQNLIINASRLYLQSNELNYLENNFGRTLARKIFKIMSYYVFEQIPKKIIYKQLHGQVFIKIERKQILNYKLVPGNVFQHVNLFNSLVSLSANYHKIHQIKKQLNFEDALHASFIFFFHQIGVVDLYQKNITNQLQFFINMGKNGYLEQSVLLLQFAQNGFFNMKAFIQNKFSFILDPEESNKSYNQIDDIEYRLFQQLNFSQPLMIIFDDVKKLFTGSRKQGHRIFWKNVIDCQHDQKKFLYYEVFRTTLYFIIIKFQKFTDINPNECLDVWNSISCFIIQNYQNFHFLSIISFFINTNIDQKSTFFTKDMKILECFEFFKQKFHSIILVNLVNISTQINVSCEEIIKNFYKIPFSDVYNYQAAVNIKNIIILLWTCNNLNTRNQELFDCFKDKIRILLEEISPKFDILQQIQYFLFCLSDSINQSSFCFDENFQKQLFGAQKFLQSIIHYLENVFK